MHIIPDFVFSRCGASLAVMALLLAPHAHAAAAPPALAVPFARITPRIDAAPDDPAWKTAAATEPFTVSFGPEAKGDVAMPTRAYLLWDAGRLYVRFVCFGGDAWSTFAKHGDPLYKQDCVEIFLDPKGDGREWIELEISPNNVVFEQLAVLTAQPRYESDNVLTHKVLDRDWWTDSSWNLDGLKTAARRVTKDGKTVGWIVDASLPAVPLLRRLGVHSFHPMTIRANLCRYDEVLTQGAAARKFLPMNWAPVRYGCPHISPKAMGYLRLKPRE